MTQHSRTTTMELSKIKIQMLAVLIFLLAQLYPILATGNKQPANRRPGHRPVNPISPVAGNRLPNHPPMNPTNLPAPRNHRQTPFKPTSNKNRAGRRPRAKRSRRNRMGARRRRRHSRGNRNRSPTNRTYLEAYRRRQRSQLGRSSPINRGNNQPKVEKNQTPNRNINPRKGQRRSPVNSPAPVKPVHMPHKPINPPKKNPPPKTQLPVKPINPPKNYPPPKTQLPVKPKNPPTKNVPVPVKQSPVNPPTTKTPIPKNPVKNTPVETKQSPLNPPPKPTSPSSDISPPNDQSPINNNLPPTDNNIPQTSNKSPMNENPSRPPTDNQSPPEPNDSAPPNRPTKVEQSEELLEFLVEHNKVRSSVDQPFYVWDKKLEDFARSWANERIEDCKMIHSEGPYGENLFWGGSNRWTAAEAVRLWADERKFYNTENNTCQAGKTCGHYTQIVWRDSNKLGCARVECRKGGVFIICAYDPCGNYEGESPFENHETQ